MRRILTLTWLLFILIYACTASLTDAGIAVELTAILLIPLLAFVILPAVIEGGYLHKKLEGGEFGEMFFLSYIANIITAFAGIAYFCVFLVIYTIISHNQEIQNITQWALGLLFILLLFWAVYKIKYRFISHIFRKEKINIDPLKIQRNIFNACLMTYLLDMTLLIFALLSPFRIFP